MLSEEVVTHTDSQGGRKERYVKKQLLGNGGFARCYLMVNQRTQQKFAGKVIRRRQLRDKSARLKVMQQIDIHRSLEHPNVVKFYDMFEYEGEVYIILQLCQNNSLKEFLKSRAKCYLLQIIAGVDYLHENGVLHRDIKLGNIFLSYKMEVKIGDFGLSTKLKNGREKRYTTCGTPNYIAPEILSENGHGLEVDVWAIGIMLYAMLVGKPPFQSQTVQETYKRIRINDFQFPKEVPVSSEAKSLIRSILQSNPKTRLTLADIRKHQFLANQRLPATMPPYTISIPPQSNFLKQYMSERHMKLAIYPRKVSAVTGMPEEYPKTNNTNMKPHKQKLNRVLSCDKNIFKLSLDKAKDKSELNRGIIYNSRVRFGSHLPGRARSETDDYGSGGYPSAIRRHQNDGNEVICYFDMTSKYGVGYLLSNGNYGVIFNDQTSLTRLINNQFIYFSGGETRHSDLPQGLNKKGQILKLCLTKLGGYKQKNVLIPYQSGVIVKKYVRFEQGLVLKLSNSVMQFFWGSDSVVLRGFHWIKWRVNGEEGEGGLASRVPVQVESRVSSVREFLKVYSQKSQRRRDR